MPTQYTTPPAVPMVQCTCPVLTEGSWPLARTRIQAYIPPGQNWWEGSINAYFAQHPSIMPFFIIITGQDFLLLYQRNLRGQLGLPVAIVRIARAAAAAAQVAA